MKKYKFMLVLSLLSNWLSLPSGRENWTFLSQLQELCPYSSFCEVNATLMSLENDINRPCCSSCSCKPDCETFDNCCSFKFGKTEILRKCTSPVVTRANVPATKFVMIHSCSPKLGQQNDGNTTLCVVNKADFKSFAPVMSTQTGDIYVNAECAFCNDIYDIIPWKLSVSCPMGIDDHSLYMPKLLQGEDAGLSKCRLSYIPEQHAGLESRECVTDVIRECNVTGLGNKWEPFWEHCPMFNATYTKGNLMFGNIFCYMCNVDESETMVHLCSKSHTKHPFSGPFTAMLDGISFEGLDVITPNYSKHECGPAEKLVPSFKTECRPVLCPWGQFRHGGKCGYYSKKWIGGPFTAVLKLTPLDRTRKIYVADLFGLYPEQKFSTKATWLKRKAMKAWNISTLYRPSDDGKYVDYLVVMASYPGSSVDPQRLRTVLERTLKETWQLVSENNGNITFHLQVQFDRYAHYTKRPKDSLRSVCLNIADKYVFLNIFMVQASAVESYLLEFYFPHEGYTTSTESNLNELFLCEQVTLREEEFQILVSGNLLFKITNETLYGAEYQITLSGFHSICLHRFSQNRFGLNGAISSSYNDIQDVMLVGLLLAMVINDGE